MTPPSAPARDPASTRERLLDTAERLFAEQGFDGTSLRQITREAGVNLAAIHYHFGSKDALIDAVFDRLIRPINEARLERLDGVEREAGEGAPELERVIEAFVRPPLEASIGSGELGARRMRLVGRVHAEREHISRQLFVRQFEDVFRRFHAALGRCLPELDPETIAWRMHFMIGAMVHVVLTAGDPSVRQVLGPDGDGLEPDALARRLVPFLAAGMRAGEKGTAP